MKVVITILAAAIVVLGMSAPAAAEDGAALYKAKCQVCHGADGKPSAAGEKMGAKDFHAPEVAKMSDADLIKITKEGKGKMPAYAGKLTDDQITELIKHVRSLK
jgi:mono/diheme cytochrome c family protein